MATETPVAPSSGVRSSGNARRWRSRLRLASKPRRRTELGLLLIVVAVLVALYALMELGYNSQINPAASSSTLPSSTPVFLVGIIALSFAAHLANRWLAPRANPVIVPLAALLNGIGFIIIVRWNPWGQGHQPNASVLQGMWTVLGVVAYIATLAIVRRSRDLDRYRYVLLLAAVVLMLLPLAPGIGENINGARLWIHLGSFSLQPIEFAKILLCIFFASYFAENRELLSIPTARVGNRLVIDPRPLVPILLVWAFAMAIIGGENDIGFALLIFTVFISLLWITTGRIGYLVFGMALFGAGAVVASQLFHQFHGRVSLWLNPWPGGAQGPGKQLIQSWYNLAAGGISGTGLGLGHSPSQVPFLTSDMMFSAIGEEMGLLGTAAVILAYLLIIGGGMHIAQRARSVFSRLTATGLTLFLGFQAFFIMAGVVRLLPLTGITLPFVAKGGSSLVASYIVLALLMRISDEEPGVPPLRPDPMALRQESTAAAEQRAE